MKVELTLRLVPPEPIRLAPEQEACEHPAEGLRWNGWREVFICWECGGQLVIPELREAMLLSVASE